MILLQSKTVRYKIYDRSYVYFIKLFFKRKNARRKILFTRAVCHNNGTRDKNKY
jgi:hypothetical protein